MSLDNSKISEIEIKEGHTYKQWFVAIAVNLSALTYGMQAGWISPSIKTLQSSNSPTGCPLSDNELSVVGSTQSLVAVIGVPLFSFLADKYGRKTSILTIAGLQAVGWVIKLFSSTTLTIVLARAFCGLPAGGCFVIIPMYVKEISQDNVRGLVGSLLIMFQNSGILFIYALGAYLDYFTMLWIVLWLPIVQIFIMIKAPESPAYLMKTGKVDEAASIIAFLRGLDAKDEIIQKEIECMQKEDLYFKSLPDVSFFSIFKEKAWRVCFFKIMALITIHASNGTFAIMTFASSILSSSSQSSVMNAELQSLSFPFTMILAAFVSMYCVERYGRKPVLATSLALSTASILCVASVVLTMNQGSTVPSWIPLTAMIICVAAYAFGLSPVPFIMMSEMFNFQIRAKAIGALVTYSWFFSFIQILIFNPLSAAIGLEGIFYFYAAINIIGLFIAVVFLPETKGKSIEQIENEIRAK